MGLEDTPQAYVSRMVELFRELRRVLRDDGLLFVNLGDSYNGYPGNVTKAGRLSAHSQKARHFKPKGYGLAAKGNIPAKSLMLIPQRFAIAMVDNGWILRSEIIWHKRSPMPESVTDRPTKAHEVVYMFAKRRRYWSDMEAVRTTVTSNGGDFSKATAAAQPNHGGESHRQDYAGANLRDVFTLSSESFSGAHFATFPTALIRPLITLGCPERCCPVCGAGWERVTERVSASGNAERDWQGVPEYQANRNHRQEPKKLGSMGTPSVTDYGFRPSCDCATDLPPTPGIVLDPFMGAGTTALVARQLGRDHLGSELNPDYIEIATKRIADADPFQPKALATGEVQLSLFGDEPES